MKFSSNNKTFDLTFSLILLVLLSILAFPSLSNPPISDYWPTMFHPFHSFENLPGPAWQHVLNIDPCEQMRYQPLSRIFYYVLHNIFGSNYIMYNVINFVFYYLCMLLLYKFLLLFIDNKLLASIFIGLTTFLFSHFDIILWSCHMYILIGLIMFLLGFIFYVDLLKTGKKLLLLPIMLFFITGMWCYEAFVLWPFAIIILSTIKIFKNKSNKTTDHVVRNNLLILSIVYLIYVIVFLYTRSIGTYETTTYKYSEFLRLSNYLLGALVVLFNTFYNTILVNIFPMITFPLQIRENIYFGGPLIKFFENTNNSGIIFIIGAIVGIFLLCFLFILLRKKLFEDLKIICLFLFLMFTAPFVIFSLRMVDNAYLYSITEFRYQFLPNLFFMLTVAYFVSNILKLPKHKIYKFYSIVIPIFVLNIISILLMINIYREQLTPLKIMFSSIRNEIMLGNINSKDKLYIDRSLPEYMPSLCWNIEMGERFIKEGNYKWIFSKKELDYFTEDLKDSAWVIDKESFTAVRKADSILQKKVKKIYDGKEEQLRELALYYIDQGDLNNAKKYVDIILKIDPDNFGNKMAKELLMLNKKQLNNSSR